MAKKNDLKNSMSAGLTGGLDSLIQSTAGRMKKIKAAERKRKQRQRCHALEPFKPA